MTSIFPSPCWEIWMVSPRLPVRPSTLMRSWRNFSNAWMSKILSLTGCEQLMMNFLVIFWPFFAAAPPVARFYIVYLSLLFCARERSPFCKVLNQADSKAVYVLLLAL